MTLRSLPSFAPILLAGAALAACLAATPAHALDLTVEVTGARSEKGFVSAALYAEAAGWLKLAWRAERVNAGPRTLLVFRDLPAGAYALAVIHDENGNGKLDSNVAGLPSEAYGFSRDARGTFGPPRFDDAVLRLDADMTVPVKLQ